ncbi:MAG: hypothetical protein RIR35_807 [Actinomycetota bacterium]|jgi:sugar lactone lactonase YvrE
MSIKVDVAAKSNCILGEGPAWNEALGHFHFVDIFGKLVLTYSPESNQLSSFALQQAPGAVIPDSNGGLILPLEDGIYHAELDGTGLKLLHSIEAEIKGNRMNDAKCDSKGVLFAGTMGDGSSATGSLYRVTSSGFKKVRGDVTISNGLAWSPSGKKMYYIDSILQGVLVADYDPDSSNVGEFKEFIKFPANYGIPDGMCSDLEGGIWVAYFGGGAVRRFDENGKETHQVQMPVSQITSCAFRGAGSTELYITTASVDLGDGKAKEIDAGNFFVADVGIPGQGTTAFR